MALKVAKSNTSKHNITRFEVSYGLKLNRFVLYLG